MRCLCVVCALSVRCLCAVCALSAPSRHDAPRMYELGVPVLLGEKPTARRQNLSRSPMTLPNFQPRHPGGNARVHVFWPRARLADLGFALHVFSLLRTCAINPTSKIVTSTFFRTDRKIDLQTFQSYTFLHSFPSVLDNDVHVFIFDKICTAPPGSPRPPLSDKIAKNFLGKLQKIVPKI